MKNKTTAQLCDQDSRIYQLLCTNTRDQINKVHPETGGNQLLAHNWGNDQARKLLEQHHIRSLKLHSAFQRHYKASFKIEYPNHLSNKR